MGLTAGEDMMMVLLVSSKDKGRGDLLHELGFLLCELHLGETVGAKRHLRALPALLGRRRGGRGGRDRRLRQRYSRLVRGEAGYADVVVAF